jgi:hypothetical protein
MKHRYFHFRTYLLVFLILLSFATSGAAFKFYPVTATTGGGTGALDAIDGNLLYPGDVAFGATTALRGYLWVLNVDGATESAPDCIAPDANAGLKRWHQVTLDIPLTLARIQAALSNDFHNIGGTDDDVPEAAALNGILTSNGILSDWPRAATGWPSRAPTTMRPAATMWPCPMAAPACPCRTPA